MLNATLKVAASAEGWLDPEAAGSDLRGSRGVAVAGAAMVFMGCCNFANTVSTILEKKRTRHVRRRGWGGGASRGASARWRPRRRAREATEALVGGERGFLGF